jgi:hypothetical protein
MLACRTERVPCLFRQRRHRVSVHPGKTAPFSTVLMVYGTAPPDSFVRQTKSANVWAGRPPIPTPKRWISSYEWYRANRDSVPEGTGVTHPRSLDQGVPNFSRKALTALITPLIPSCGNGRWGKLEIHWIPLL